MAQFAATKDNRVPGFFSSIPATVAVHGKITTDDGDDFRIALLQLLLTHLEKAGPACWRAVTPVGKCMDKDLRNTGSLGCIGQRDHVQVMAVHTAIRNQAQ